MPRLTPLAAAAALLAALPGLAPAAAGPASLDSTASVYTQSFDTLAKTGTGIYSPGLTLQGWYLPSGLYLAGNGSSSGSNTYSFGATGATDRALGLLSTSFTSVAVEGFGFKRIQFGITNNTGSALSSFTLRYDGEIWRTDGSAAIDMLSLGYRIGGSSLPTAITDVFTAPGAGFNVTSPAVAGAAGATDGNAAAWRQAGLGGTVALATPWASGSTLWLRWSDLATAVAFPAVNDGLAIDNLSLSVTAVSAVPEPQTYALMPAGLAGVGFMARRRRAG